MRALIFGAVLSSVLVSNALAQRVFGPVSIKSDVDGVPIAVSATSSINIADVGDKLIVSASVFADLVDLQRQMPKLVGSLQAPADKCANRLHGDKSPVVGIDGISLWPHGDLLIMSMHGRIDLWSCSSGPRRYALRWRKKKIAFLKISIPHIHHWRYVKKRQDATRPFQGILSINLGTRKNALAAIELAEPQIIVNGRDAGVKDGTLQFAKADIRKKIHRALQRAIDPAKLKQALPPQFQNLKMTAVAADFRAFGGHAIAEIKLAATVSGDSRKRILEQMAAAD
jgi:hypothetical protein